MHLTSLSVRHVRKLKAASIVPSQSTNLISGENGSGKTSLLESIHYLATARSFRTNRAREVISHGEESLLVSGEFTDVTGSNNRIGVKKTSNETKLRLNGESIMVASQIARMIPILNFNTESFLLLDGGPSNRRSLLDRLLFHVEHEYLDSLKRYFRMLRQRNSLLRNSAANKQITAWHLPMIAEVEKLDKWRAACISQINRYLKAMPIFERIGELELEYSRGWPATMQYADSLTDNLFRDKEAGTTSSGPHRAELRFKVGGKLAKATVSRGQGKLIIAAVVGAQAKYLAEKGKERPIMLVDDLAAELDRSARRVAVETLLGTQSQIFFTAIDATDLPSELSDKAKMFHVEQGEITPETGLRSDQE